MSPSFGIRGLGSHVCVSYHDPLCYHHSSQSLDMGTLQWQKSQRMVAKSLKAKHVRRPSISGLSLEPLLATRQLA
jgi:hypothetical protein